MKSHKVERRHCQYLGWVLFVAVLVGPSVSSDALLCHYCPLQHKARSCSNVTTTTCLADERCSSSRGRYGSLHMLSAQGCLAEVLCGTHEIRKYLGTRYNVSHTCCCEALCNSAPEPETYLKTLLGFIAHKMDDVNIGNFTENVILEEPQLDVTERRHEGCRHPKRNLSVTIDKSTPKTLAEVHLDAHTIVN